jgi:large repetitive protein
MFPGRRIPLFSTILFGAIVFCGSSAIATAQVTRARDAILPIRNNVDTDGPLSILPSIADLTTARLAHTATLLPTGRVLIVGGGDGPDMIDGFWVVDTAELLDLNTGTTSPAGSIARDQHTATLLADGSVLLTGGEVGWSGYNVIASNDGTVYDSATGTSSATGNMITTREDHTATLLPDGRVLVAGGAAPSGWSWVWLASAEIYDPASKTFTQTSDMTAARAFHTATLLTDGTVLITGGDNEYSYDSRLIAGGRAELYDPRSGLFAPTIGSMVSPRASHTATLLQDGRVLLTGGGTESAEIYDPATGLFAPTGSMMFKRSYHTATLLPNGTVLIAGGMDWRSGSIGTIEIYDPASGLFTPAGMMSQDRLWHTATLLGDGTVLLIGGASSPDGMHINALTSVEKY